MDENLKKRAKAIGVLGLYGFALYQAGSDAQKADQVNERFDARAAMITAASGATGTVAQVDLTPYTVVDKQFYNLEADYAANHDIEEQT
ncbi:MAG: hypothetical protein ABTQ25_10470 [Nitrosomonas ureae]